MKCIGFGIKERRCKSSSNEKHQSKYWCDECEENRRKHITKQLEGLLASIQEEKQR